MTQKLTYPAIILCHNPEDIRFLKAGIKNTAEGRIEEWLETLINEKSRNRDTVEPLITGPAFCGPEQALSQYFHVRMAAYRLE